MDKFLSDNSIRINMSICSKGRLGMIDGMWQVMFDPVSYILGNDFVNNIAKANRTKILS